MDKDTRKHFETIIMLARDRLADVKVIQKDITPRRAILQVHGKFDGFDVRIKEILAIAGKMYSYYLLNAGHVIVGYDKYPDFQMIRKKFG